MIASCKYFISLVTQHYRSSRVPFLQALFDEDTDGGRGGLSLVSKPILFLPAAASCVTCVCPYVRSLANAIAMPLRNSNVNSCGLLPS